MRITVIGAGVVGLACAYELQRDGHDVVVVDGEQPGQGASHGWAAKIAIGECTPVPAPGMVIHGLRMMARPGGALYVRPSLSPPHLRFLSGMARACTERQFRHGLDVNLRLSLASLDGFDAWADDGLVFERHRRGVLLVWESEAGLRQRDRCLDVFAKWQVAPRLLNGPQAQEVEPCVAEKNRYGLFFEGDEQVEPDSLCEALAALIVSRGGEVRTGVRVPDLDRRGTDVRAVRLADGSSIPCDHVVIATGAHAGELTARLGARLPVRPGKGYSVDYLGPPLPIRTSLTFEDSHVAVTQLDGRVRFASTMELAGFDLAINEKRVRAIEQCARGGFDGWPTDAPHTPPWAGLRPMSADGLPFIGPLTTGSNVLVAAGHGMLGLTQAPATARLIADGVRDPRTLPTDVSPARAFRRLPRVTGRR